MSQASADTDIIQIHYDNSNSLVL